MTRQNRTLGFIAVFIVIVLAFILFRAGYLMTPAQNAPEQNQSNSGQDAFGDVVRENNSEPSPQEKKMFSQLTANMLSCLDIKGTPPATDAPITVDSILASVQPDLGQPIGIYDRWMNWHLKTPDGKETRLRLEVSESDEGQVLKELHQFSVDRDGQISPVELPPARARNPSDDYIKELLQAGEVFYKERGAAALFNNGDRLEFLEKNNLISEIEFSHGNFVYKCQNFKASESCQCVK
jgi:hypothetical protein